MSNIPEIRFNFDKKWTVDRISSCAETLQGFTFESKKYTKKGKYNVLTISNVGGDRYIRSLRESNKVDDLPNGISEYQILKENDILISMTGNVGRVSLNKGKNNLLNQRVDVLKEFDNCDKEFLFQRLSSKDFENAMILNSQGAAQKNISSNNIKNYVVCYPEIPEQRQIASFLFNIDFLIENKKKKLVKTKQYKVTMLYKMFPQKGKLVPEIRFKDFEHEWKEGKFDIGQISKGQGFSKNDLSKKGKPLFLYGRMYTKFQIFVKDIDSFTDKNNAGTILSVGNEVVIPASGETAEDISRATAILSKGIILGGDLNIIKISKEFDSIFISILVTYTQFHYELGKIAQGKTIVHIHGSDISSIIFLYPTLEEQLKIADFFNRIDLMIANQEKEIKILEHLKATLLSKMFA
jgi:type I restriction enzyme S subunit